MHFIDTLHGTSDVIIVLASGVHHGTGQAENIFFSAVTATTLQGGLNSTSRSTLHSIVMTFWFCSLVLSIGATLNSLLKRSTYGTHGRRLFPLVTIWIHGSGPLFLTLSIGLFVVGLVLYTYVSEQKRITSILTLAFAALVTFDVLSMSGWIFFQQLGWISPKIRSWFGFRRPEPLKDKLSEWTEVQLHEKSIRDDSDTSSELSTFSESTIMDELPAFMKVQTKIGSGIRTGIQTFNTTMDTVLPKRLGPRDVENPIPADNNAIPLLENALRHLLSKTSPFEALPSSLDFPCEPYHTKTICGEICDLEYSHSGSLLVVASFDDNLKYSVVSLYVYAKSEREYQEIDTFSYKHHQGRMIKQVAWSPSGKHILVQLDDMIDLLAVTPRGLEREKVIWRSHLVTVRSVSWYTSKDIVFIAGNIVVRLPLQGETKIVPLENFLLRDVAVVPDSDLLLLAGRTVFKDIPLPEHSRVESQLKLFDMKRQVVCESIPSLDDMQYITIAASASSEQRTFNVLVGHKNARSPQLYELKIGQSRSHQLQPSSKDLLPFSEYKGSGYFVGDRQQMIFCAKGDNSIAIWDRETGATVDHGIPAEVRAKYCRRAITWNSTDANTLNFVTAGERELRFWSASMKLADSKPASASRPSLSTLAASSTPPTPSLREHVAKDTSPMSTHNATDIQIQEVGRTDL